MEKKEWLLGIDLGGTTVKLAFVEQEGTVIHKWEIPTNLLDNGMHIVTEIASSVKETLKAWPNAVLIAAGMGAPGPVDFETGSIYVAVNIGWRDYPLKSLLEDALGIPVVVDNDAKYTARPGVRIVTNFVMRSRARLRRGEGTPPYSAF